MDYVELRKKLELFKQIEKAYSVPPKACTLISNVGSVKIVFTITSTKKKGLQLSLTNPRDACEKFARFT